ncbi:putative RNA polymerase sigma factor [Polaromonas sp. CG9_12]|uniref:RNA polymerase sigma factor n=1 Tax=Polaromonas sp. CG_9.11 TaxID=2787730 RepID=UPI0004DDC9AC|nr:RNA polymerase sigma factor [Polaromonas sp. CG_9.11]MBG6076433.1 RNA polymerase sigma-70 factor (ECF subfamily) [Polaromonas sp. CG_9.11]CDS50656.1 putative RNA polymerase sigma factor [Polaromonas sp. CG9_12]
MRAQDEADIVACIPSLRRYARGLSADRERADDLVQDTLERAWGRFGLWQRRGEVRAWMFGIMHNLFIDRLRSQRSAPEQSAGDAFPESPDRATQADRLEVRDLDRALQRLPPEQRAILLLVGVEEMSYQEVAGVLGVPLGTVMSRLSRGRERLRAELEGREVSRTLQRVK